jgi:hypothetical protein
MVGRMGEWAVSGIQQIVTFQSGKLTFLARYL